MATIEISFCLHFQSAGKTNAGKYREMVISSVEQCGRTVDSKQEITGHTIQGRNSLQVKNKIQS